MDFNILDLAQYIKTNGSSKTQSNDKIYSLRDGYEIRYIENDIISTLVFVKNNTLTTYIDLTTDFSIDIANARIYKSDNVFDLIDVYYEEYVNEKQKKRNESIEKQNKIVEFLKK